MKYLSVVACFKDEGPFLREWIEFHLLNGVEHFYLYDNSSSDDPTKILKKYVDSAVLTLFSTNMACCQLACFFHALTTYRDRSRWMAFIDIDEFLFCPSGESLPSLLRNYEEFPALGANWLLFGTSGHVRRPPGLVTENYFKCAHPDYIHNRHVKILLDPNRTLCPGPTPHEFIFVNSRFPAVDENRIPLQGAYRDSSVGLEGRRIRINHYSTKSHEDWAAKLNRGRADTRDDHPFFTRPPEFFECLDRNECHDDSMRMFLPSLKARLSDN